MLSDIAFTDEARVPCKHKAGHGDSVEKVFLYLDGMAAHRECRLGPSFFRTFACPVPCGACCTAISLDFFPGRRWEAFRAEYPAAAERFEPRTVTYKGTGRSCEVMSYRQDRTGGADGWCTFLRGSLCGIHKSNPLSCTVAPMVFIAPAAPPARVTVMRKPFGRGWQMSQVTGRLGVRCKEGFTAYTIAALEDDVQVLEDLADMAALVGADCHFRLAANWLRFHAEEALSGRITASIRIA